ncbi:alpha/beta fold hydrolase [Acidomonas methanolica]|uniref:alpha/beta fold hydrolase n=1 Tax=Acidomonas methanolica TaxID=437 RepID=UPI002119C127|nr:alpha/beta fold hydrolase [Acidomonas methanolica]MCQ9155854.1 alpha/beta fold hydrolase [Acidomonas methanolica]
MQLHAIEQGPERSSGKLPVVFLHGLFGRARNFGALQRRVAADRRTLALDLRNHGGSPHGMMTYDLMAEDVRETLAARDALPALVIGHSMGGKTAMRLALAHPETVAGLLVADIAPTPRPFSQDGLVAALRGVRFPARLDLREAKTLLAEAIPDTAVRELMAQNLRLGDDPGWAIGLEEIAASLPALYDWPERSAARYDGPTLFVRGGRSDYVRDDDLPAIRRFFPAARIETLPEAGHWVHVEAPERFAALMLDFIAHVADEDRAGTP